MKPKEKMMFFGPDALTNAELLSLLINRGDGGRTAVDVASEALSYVRESSIELDNADVRELTEVSGIGSSKACAIVAAMALGKRLSSERASRQKNIVTSAEDIAKLMMDQFGSEKREHFVAFFLNAKLQLESQYVVSIGNLDRALVHPREVLSTAVRRSAAAIIVAHNHPSGDPTPSSEDIAVTKKLIDASNLLEIRLLDHVIVGNDSYISLEKERLCSF